MIRQLSRLPSAKAVPLTRIFYTVPAVVEEVFPLPWTPAPKLPKEYEAAHVWTRLPGPRSTETMQRYNMYQPNPRNIVVDHKACIGNYVVDVDRNRFLDISGESSSQLPIGFNHPAIEQAMSDPVNAVMLVHQPSLGISSSEDWFDRIGRILKRVAPKGLPNIDTLGREASPYRKALKLAFDQYRKRKGEASASSGSLAVLSFSEASHQRIEDSLPSFCPKGPIAPFPKLKYPLEHHIVENQEEERRCLAEVENILTKQPESKAIAAMIVQPIQADSGDLYASRNYFQELRHIAAKHQVTFIVDESETGAGVTGTFWAHEEWGLENPPDIVTFGKRMQFAGYYSKPEYPVPQLARIFHTWLGDRVKMIQVQTMVKSIEEDNLLENTQITGDYLFEGLADLEASYPRIISNVRGIGSYLAFDCASRQLRDQIINSLRQRGAEVGSTGEATIRIRPALVFQPRHADEFLGILERVCAKI